jgi:hypothetical protein
MANQGVPPGGRYPSSAELAALLKPFLGDVTSLKVDRRTLYGKQASRIFQDAVTPADEELGYMNSGTYYNPQSYGAAQTADQTTNGAANGDAPAFVKWDVPTSSTDYQRPRTVAAGYDEARQTMTVVFRDGTFYNYYEVTPGEWSSFSASFSKGRPWLNRKNKNQAADGLFVNKPRGDAGDMAGMDPQVREALYRVSRTQQMKAKPRKGRTSQTVYQTQPRGANFYGLEDSPRGRKRQQMQVPNRLKSDIRANRGGVNPSARAGQNRRAS